MGVGKGRTAPEMEKDEGGAGGWRPGDCDMERGSGVDSVEF